MKKIYYEKIRMLMGKYILDKKDIALIVDKSYRQTSKILHHEISKETEKPYMFSIDEVVNLVLYFRELGEKDLTIEVLLKELFFNDVLSNETKSA